MDARTFGVFLLGCVNCCLLRSLKIALEVHNEVMGKGRKAEKRL